MLRLHLKLTGRPAEWKDTHLVSGNETPPFLNLASGAQVRVLLTNAAGTEVVSASALTNIKLEVWRSKAMRDGELLIAPAAVAVATAAPTLEAWNAKTGSTYYTAAITLTAAETAAAIASLDSEVGEHKAYMEIRATEGGENVLLGAGPVILYRGSTGGTPVAAGEMYYTQAEVDALLDGKLSLVASGDGYATLTDGTTTITVSAGTYQS